MLFEFRPQSALLLPFVVPGLVLAGHLLIRAIRTGTLADGLLGLLLLLNVLPVAQWMLGFAGWYDSHDHYSTLMFYVPWRPWLAWGPVFYLYFRSLTNQAFGLRRHWWHLAPWLVYVGAHVAMAVYDIAWGHKLLGQALPYHFGTKGRGAAFLDELNALNELIGYASMLGYGLATLRRYRRYRRYLDDHFSDTTRLRFRGLRDLLLAALLALLVWLGLVALDALVGPLGYGDSWYAYLANGVLIYYLSVIGLQANYAAIVPLRFEAESEAPSLLNRPPLTPVAAGDPPVEEIPFAMPAGSGINVLETRASATILAPELQPWREKLLRLMEEEQPWLEPELTLSELAHRLRTNTSLLSHVINTGCGQNFNDFVNSYRVAEAERKLQDPYLSHYSLVGIALECGFNSKSTFNRVFKKLTGRTPGEVSRLKS
ncbi:helix-turn-helix transcriptional regulator [Hymenobacter sp. BT664]|uniref:Helix-turn-helix transcriptional regulator n=1 Tax=Hymenobacter montanus TaxID=2771359 RepID=A0A927BAU6_9BACT|nr:AraC family transcriptional regulator [Hymenobacter montanus]MBD2766712.1 helix-turn-helix transcriptional regulator [Hymenobacter montanus]